MNEQSELPPAATPIRRTPRASGHRTLFTVLGVMAGLGVATAASAGWWYHQNLQAAPFTPVQLTVGESKALDQKVDTLKGNAAIDPAVDAMNSIVLTEREINGYLEKQGIGDKVRVSMRNGQIAAIALLPVDKDVPVVGGRTIRLKIAFSAKLDADHHLSFGLADINVGGFSLPNAWVGGIKGLDLLGGDQGGDESLNLITAGIKDLQIRQGELRLVLND